MTGRARLSHLDAEGRARMVDVGAKPVTARMAVAGATVLMQPATLRLIARGALPKGDVRAVARLAGIVGAEATREASAPAHPLQPAALLGSSPARPPRRTATQAPAPSPRCEPRTGPCSDSGRGTPRPASPSA